MIEKKKLILIVSVVGLFLLALIVLFIVDTIKPKSYLELAVAPERFYISVDDGRKTSKKSGDKMTVSPGNHKITISQDEFDEYTTEISVDEDETKRVLVSLNPTTDAAVQSLSNDSSNQIMQEVHNQENQQRKAILEENYPLITHLPITTRSYIIAPCPSLQYPNDDTKTAICITTTTDEAKPFAIKAITDLDFDLDDYEIIWQNDPVRY